MNEWSDPDLETSADEALRRALRGLGGAPAPADATLARLRPTMRRARRRHQAAVAVRTGALGVAVIFGGLAVSRSLSPDDDPRPLDVGTPGPSVTSTTVDIGESVTVEATTTTAPPTTTTVASAATVPGPGSSVTSVPASGGPTGGPTSTAPAPGGSTPPTAPTPSTTAPTVAQPPTAPTTTADDDHSDEDHSDEDHSDESSDESSDEDSSGSGSGSSGSGSGDD